MEEPAGTLSIPGEFPYDLGYASEALDESHPTRCKKCGSEHTSSYVRLMVASNRAGAISGDLIIHPIRVITCLNCNRITYKNFQTLRDS